MADASELISPTLRRLEVAAALRRHRRSAGLTMADVMQRLGISASKISRIETGTRHVQPDDLENLCLLYGTPEDERAELRRWAEESRRGSAFRKAAGTRTLWVDFVELEHASRQIDDYKSSMVTALLQTSEYTRAIFRAYRPNAPSDVVEERVQIWRMRQEHLLGNDSGPAALTFIADEAALHRVVGGAETMRDQLDYLTELSLRDRVTLRIIPFIHGAHPGLESLFTILSFHEPVQDRVYVDSLLGSTFLQNSTDLERFRGVFDRLRELALEPADTRSLIASVRRSV